MIHQFLDYVAGKTESGSHAYKRSSQVVQNKVVAAFSDHSVNDIAAVDQMVIATLPRKDVLRADLPPLKSWRD